MRTFIYLRAQKKEKNTNMPGGVKKSARVRVKMDIPDLPQSATKEEKRIAYLLAYNLERRSRSLNKQRKRTSHGRTLSVPNFDAVMRFGHEESMELLKGGFRVSGSPLSEQVPLDKYLWTSTSHGGNQRGESC